MGNQLLTLTFAPFLYVRHHLLLGAGVHSLICSVLYTSSAGEQAIFHKTYKFAVAKPIDVKTKAYNIDVRVIRVMCLRLARRP